MPRVDCSLAFGTFYRGDHLIIERRCKIGTNGRLIRYYIKPEIQDGQRALTITFKETSYLENMINKVITELEFEHLEFDENFKQEVSSRLKDDRIVVRY